MVPPHRRAGGGLEPAGRALEPAGRASEPAGRTPDPAGRSLEPAGRALEPAGRPGASWEGQLRGRGGGRRQRERKDGPGPVMVSDTLCPAVNVLALDRLFTPKFIRAADPKGNDVL